jgi:glyoxylase-like metal-dependent hydrolase (beta-lactamase superfamily II)
MATKYQPHTQVPSAFHKKIGTIVVTVVSDGTMEFDLNPFFELGTDKALQLLQENLQATPPHLNTNGFIVNNHGHVTLIDTGLGSNFGPSVGHLVSNLRAAGYSTDEVDTVLLTHMHPDHVNGLILADGSKAFPHAEVVVHEREYDFWMDDEILAHAPEQGKGMFHMVRAALAPYEGKIVTFSSQVPLPSITAIEAPGHTPGHTAFLIESEGEKLLIWGDIVHNATIQLLRPEEKLAMDVDSDLAVSSRKRLLDFASSEGVLVTGMHLDFPAFGYVKKVHDHYVYVPKQWRNSEI